MNNFTPEYLSKTIKSIENFKAFKIEDEIPYQKAVLEVVNEILIVQRDSKKIMLVGNGGSAGITSHMALDFWKNGKVKALAFNDPSLLTALGNDIGYEFVFSKSVEMFGDKGDLLIAISSSGNSPNIINASIEARNKGCKVITLSGFSLDNKLIKLGDYNFYVDSYSYGIVEVLHTLMIHNLLDEKLYSIDNIDIHNKNTPI